MSHVGARRPDCRAPLVPPAGALISQVFGMKVIRHEENAEPCDITCNGRYNGAWSKTMVGYKTEDIAYCLEVTYNYGEKSFLPRVFL